MAVRITCINKSGGYHENPHEAISHFGWLNESTNESGKVDRPGMVKFIKDGNQAYVKDSYGSKVYCYVRTSSRGIEFLQTQANDRPTDNLLSLPECK